MSDASRAKQVLVRPDGMEWHVGDMTVTMGAELTLGRVQEKLAEQEQWLAIDGELGAPVGRLVERNSTGPLRLGFGAWRDLLLGVQFYNGRGELISAGGRTVKNVAGYDLSKLMIGQHGVLGRIATITARTYRRPAGAILARFGALAGLVKDLLPTPLRPQWAVLKDEELLCGYLGDEATLGYYEAKIPVLRPTQMVRRRLEEDIEHRQELWVCRGATCARVSVPPMQILALVHGAKLEGWVADAAFGVVLTEVQNEEVAQRIKEAVAGLGGSLYMYGRAGEIVYWQAAGAERELLARLKRAFDPDGKLRSMSNTDERATSHS